MTLDPHWPFITPLPLHSPLNVFPVCNNDRCVELIEGKGWGIQGVLDDVCIMPKGDDTAFLDRLMQSQQVKVHRHFGLAKNRREMFVVHHYAGSVSYHVEGFCEKNKDLLAIDLVNLMRGSQSEFFQKLFENTASAADMATPSKPGRRGAGGGMGGSVAYKSVSATFKTDLASLMEAINAADPHFVRCINPNSQKKAELFEDTKAVEQLRCGGVIEAVRMCRESYPSRYTHDDFIGTFSCICPQAAQGPDLRQNCFAIVSSIKVDPKLYRLGKTMILLKREVPISPSSTPLS
jgi:myosin heavy subunit